MNVVWHVSETVAFGDRFLHVYRYCHGEERNDEAIPTVEYAILLYESQPSIPAPY